MSHISPKPIVIDLNDRKGYEWRVKAKEFVKSLLIRGLEAGSKEEQSYGVLAETVIRDTLKFPPIDPKTRELGFDIVLPTGVKMDVKCRGGTMKFSETYVGTDGIEREAKHNFWARQLEDPRLETDIYLLTHLQVPKRKIELPGSPRQRKWYLFVAGWVSKARVKRDGVYLPRGSLTERGSTWFAYRGEEVEFYHRHLNELTSLNDLLRIDKNSVKEDEVKPTSLQLTSVDAVRIALDLVGRGILSTKALDSLKHKLDLDVSVPPVFHPNQYFHFVRWLKSTGLAGDEQLEKLDKIMKEKKYGNKEQRSL